MNTNPVKGTVLLSIASVIFMISSYVTNVALGRILNPVDYGYYGIIVSLISLVNIVQTSGVSQSVSKFLAESKSNPDSILKTGLYLQFFLSFIFFLLFYFLPGTIAEIFNDKSLIPFIKVAAFVFPLFGIYALLFDYYNGLHNFKKQAIMHITYSVSKLTFVIIFVLVYKIYGAFFGYIIAPLLSILFCFKTPNFSVIGFPLIKLINGHFLLAR